MANTTTTSTRRLQFNKFGGLLEDPRGGHCVFEYQGQTMLGQVKDVVLTRRAGGTNGLNLDVQFMNGESWPFQPIAAQVLMLRRDWI